MKFEWCNGEGRQKHLNIWIAILVTSDLEILLELISVCLSHVELCMYCLTNQYMLWRGGKKSVIMLFWSFPYYDQSVNAIEWFLLLILYQAATPFPICRNKFYLQFYGHPHTSKNLHVVFTEDPQHFSVDVNASVYLTAVIGQRPVQGALLFLTPSQPGRPKLT